MWFWWKTPSSSSSSKSKLLLFMMPFVVVFWVVYGANWLLAWKYQPWTKTSLITSVTSKTSLTNSHDVEEDPNIRLSLSTPPPKEIGIQADFQLMPSSVVGAGGSSSADQPLSDDGILNHSVSPLPLAAQETRHEQVIQKEDMVNISTPNSTGLISPNSLNNSGLSFPLTSRIKRKASKLEKLEANMMQARALIRAAKNGNQSHDPDYIPNGPMYWNPKSFHRSYLEMEKQFKVYVYEEGEPPIFHYGPCKSIYSMEGNFIYFIEKSPFRTTDPDKARSFFLPIGVASIVHHIFDKIKRDWHPLKQTLRDYVHLVAGKYPYWNQSQGADHFMFACHDWGPELSSSVPELYKNSVRCLCNANTSEGFNPSKDVSVPEINLPGGETKGMLGGPSPSRRPVLVFFAGALHGPIRPILLEHWENKDKDVQVQKYLPKGVSYYGMMRKSRYCICPSGFEVASPRMVEALYTGCVPVLIKDHYVAPFGDVLNWKTFSVEIPVKDIPNLKRILSSISPRQYIRMQRRGQQIRRHFEINFPPKRYDVLHMILHSVWLRRLNVQIHGHHEDL